MAFTVPDRIELRHIGERLGLGLSASDAAQFHAFLAAMEPAFGLIEKLDESCRSHSQIRAATRPAPAENPYNAWNYRTKIQGEATGKLSGRKVAVKDCIAIAGVPLTNGSALLGDHIPEADASVVARIIAQGAEISGTAVCEYFCFSSNSGTAVTGPVHNPRAPGRTTGGSSSGCAALLAAGEVDFAIGADQAGSIRMPASLCGIVGLKPTYGLVPYTGAISIEHTIDHLGPMARTVEDCALLLEVIAGSDGIDGRQAATPVGASYSSFIESGIAGLRCGVLVEGFGHLESDPVVDRDVRAAADALRGNGAIVEEVSIPWHRHGSSIWLGVAMEGTFANMVYGHGVGYGSNSDYAVPFMDAVAGWRGVPDQLAPTIKGVLLIGAALDRYGGKIYAKAQNLRRRLRAEYDSVLRRFDVLIMPTTPITAPELPPPDASVEQMLAASWQMTNNTCQFNLTGHPAVSVPCATQSSRPVGVMIVGRHFQESIVLGVAQAITASA